MAILPSFYNLLEIDILVRTHFDHLRNNQKIKVRRPIEANADHLYLDSIDSFVYYSNSTVGLLCGSNAKLSKYFSDPTLEWDEQKQ